MKVILPVLLFTLVGNVAAQSTRSYVTDNSGECVYRNLCSADAKPGPYRSDDRTPYGKVREFFFPEMGVDPMRRKYEELFGHPYPPPGNQQFEASSPFSEVRRFNDAFDRAVAGERTVLSSNGNQLTVAIVLPNSEKKDLRVFVNEERILLSLATPAPPSPYYIVRRQELSIPSPDGVDPSTAKIDRTGDEIRISFADPDADSGN